MQETLTSVPPGSPARDTRPEPAARTPRADRATRVALVGTGFIADTHLSALREVPAVEVVALCDVNLARDRKSVV